MKKLTKLIICILLLVGAAFSLFWISLEAMDIEDRYGDLQDVYYKSKNQDIIIDSKKRVGFIYKDSRRIFVEEMDCMKDLNEWVEVGREQINFSIYRPEFSETLTGSPSYDYVNNLIRRQKLEPVISR